MCLHLLYDENELIRLFISVVYQKWFSMSLSRSSRSSPIKRLIAGLFRIYDSIWFVGLVKWAESHTVKLWFTTICIILLMDMLIMWAANKNKWKPLSWFAVLHTSLWHFIKRPSLNIVYGLCAFDFMAILSSFSCSICHGEIYLEMICC